MTHMTHADWLQRKAEKIRKQMEKHNSIFLPLSTASDEGEGVNKKLSREEVFSIIRPKKKQREHPTDHKFRPRLTKGEIFCLLLYFFT